jgi:tetratricopeptide (TPR) repeat protein
MTTPGRNSPCPCGSGKRYKDCHGSIFSPGGPLPRADEQTQRQLDAALAAQQAGRLAEAIALYEAVIADHPDTFDALHMLGVTHYQRGDFERARGLVASALGLSPFDRAARHNLQLLDSVLERRSVERDICRETLPRLAPRCIAPVARADDLRWRDTTLDLIVSRSDALDRPAILERLAGWLEAAALTVWLYPGMTQPVFATWPVRLIDPEAGTIPDRRQAVFVGADRSPAEWYARAGATDVALFCDDEAPCLLLDRIPELAREGRMPLRLLFGSAAHAQRIGLPGIVIAGAATPA